MKSKSKSKTKLLGHKWTSKAGDTWLTFVTKAEFVKETKNPDYVTVSFKQDDLEEAIELFEERK